MGKAKRIISVLLLALTLIATLSASGCTKKLSRDEATNYIKDLVEKSYEINVIVFGEGLEHLDEKDKDYPLYSPIIENEKYNSISDIRLAIRKVYSSEYARNLEEIAFVGAQSGIEGTTLYPRYIENIEGELCILNDYTILDYENESGEKYEGIKVLKYDPSTVEITKISRRFVEANVQSYDKTTTIKVTLIRQEVNGEFEWRLHSPTC